MVNRCEGVDLHLSAHGQRRATTGYDESTCQVERHEEQVRPHDYLRLSMVELDLLSLSYIFWSRFIVAGAPDRFMSRSI